MNKKLDELNEYILNLKQGKEPKTKRDLQALDTKKRIYLSGVKLISDKGFLNVTIDDITSEAGVSKGSFYSYFESKEELIEYTYISGDRAYIKIAQSVSDYPFEKQLIEFFKRSYGYFELGGLELLKATVSIIYNSFDYDPFNPDRTLCKYLDSLLEKGVREGKIDKKANLKDYRNLIVSTLVGTEIQWCHYPSSSTLVDMVVKNLTLLMDGLLKE